MPQEFFWKLSTARSIEIVPKDGPRLHAIDNFALRTQYKLYVHRIRKRIPDFEL